MRRALCFIFVVMFLFISKLSFAGKLINDHLPKWMEIDVQQRYRYEYKSDFDFNESLDDNKGYSLWRSRLNLALKPTKDLKLFYQFQDSRIFSDSISGSKAAFENWGENRQLWAQLLTDKLACEYINLSKAGFKIGRQELSYGSQRLIGPVDWSNVGQTFDGGKVMFEFEPAHLTIDFFGGNKTNNKSPREKDDFYDGSSNDRVMGYYAVYSGFKDVMIDQYLFNRNTKGKTVSFSQTGDGEIDDYTIGARIKGKIHDTNFDYELEAAKQFGNSGSLDVDAQMVVAILGYTFKHNWKPRIGVEFDYGSGDENSTDNNRKTFNNLYPTNHLFYGFMDLASLQNLNDYSFTAKVSPLEKLELRADLHFLYLNTAKDNLYAADRTIKRRSTASASDAHVGNEVDVLAKYKICDYADIAVGYSHLFTGDFLSETGADDDADFAYVQTVFNF